MLQIPFYLNHGHRCAQAAMKSILKAVMPERDFSYSELDRLTNHSRDQITFPCQIASAFAKIGLDFLYYTKPDGFDIVLSPDFLDIAREKYGTHLDDMLAKVDIDILRESVRSLIGNEGIIGLDEKPHVQELEKAVNEGRIPICLINYDVFVGRENKFNGHYLVLTGFSDGEVIYHDNGPKMAGPNKRTPLDRFARAWDLCFFDHDLIIVSK